MVEHPTSRPTSTELLLISQLASIEKGQQVAQATRERNSVMLGQMALLLQQIFGALTDMQSTRTGRTGQNMVDSLIAISKKVDLVHKLYRFWVWSRLVRWPAFAYGALKYIGWA